MKKSTGIVFLVVVALAAVAYFWDWKRNPGKPEENPNDVKLAFTIKPEDQINSITVTRQGATMKFVLKDDGWYMTEPLAMRANQTAVADLAHDFGIVVEDRTFPATPEALQNWGLTNPKLDMQFTLRSGGTHRLRTGAGDFSGLEVYSQVDGDTKNVILITKTVAEGGDKPLEEFRDHAVLNFSYFEATGFDLRNSFGEVAAKKQGDTWNIVKPLEAPGATQAIAPMLQNVGAAKLTHFVDDNAKNASRDKLEKYGLASPAVRFSVTLTNGTSTELLLGKKEGNEYYAMDTTRGMIFRAPENLAGALNKKVTDLQAKVLFTGSEVEVSRLEVRSPAGTTKCVKDNRGALVIEQPAGQTSQAPDCPDFLIPLQNARAQKIDNQPADSIRAKFTRPAVVVTLTIQGSSANRAPVEPPNPSAPAGEKQKEIKIEISAPAGNTVYVKSSASQAVYEFDKQTFDALSAKPAPADAPAAAPAK